MRVLRPRERGTQLNRERKCKQGNYEIILYLIKNKPLDGG